MVPMFGDLVVSWLADDCTAMLSMRAYKAIKSSCNV